MGTAGSWQWRRGERCLPRPLTLASQPLPASEPAYCNSTLSVGCLPCWPPYLSVRLLCGQSSQRQPGVTFASRWPRQRVFWPRERQGRKAGPRGDPDRWGSFFWRSSGLLPPGGEGLRRLCAAAGRSAGRGRRAGPRRGAGLLHELSGSSRRHRDTARAQAGGGTGRGQGPRWGVLASEGCTFPAQRPQDTGPCDTSCSRSPPAGCKLWGRGAWVQYLGEQLHPGSQ